MTREESYKITSNDYADLLIERYDHKMAENQDITLHPINEILAVAYMPAKNMTASGIMEYQYGSIPKCYGLLSVSSIEASGVNKLREIKDFNLRGQGVIAGFIDTGIDYTNPVFRYGDNTSRISYIWDQTIESGGAPDGFYYGTEYSAYQINLALTSVNPYNVVPSRDTVGHGTMLASVAAGSDYMKKGFAGIAPDTEIAVVKLKPAKPYLKEFFAIPEDVLCYQENDIIMGIEYLIKIARRLDRPISICIGMGTNQGSHDGDCILCHYLSHIGSNPGIAFMIAGGNEGNMGHHYFGEVNSDKEYDTVELNVGEGEFGFSMELWGYAPNIIQMDLFSPDGAFITHIPRSLKQQDTVFIQYQTTTLYIDNQVSEELTGEQMILLRFFSPLKGIWRFRIFGGGDLITRFHIWLPVRGFISEHTYFINADNQTTLTNPANITGGITVTAYDHLSDTIYYYAGRGFTRDGGLKPDVAAPGVNITAPDLTDSLTVYTGSSVAAAHATGIAAMILEWGIVRGNYTNLDVNMLRRMLTLGARRLKDISYPNADWGFGMIDIYKTIANFYSKN